MQPARTFAAALAVALLGTATAAWGESGTARGIGALGEKNLADRTLSIDGRVHLVTAETVIRDQDGNRITLEALPVPEAGGPPNLWPLYTARFEAVAEGDELVLRSLRLVPPPR